MLEIEKFDWSLRMEKMYDDCFSVTNNWKRTITNKMLTLLHVLWEKSYSNNFVNYISIFNIQYFWNTNIFPLCWREEKKICILSLGYRIPPSSLALFNIRRKWLVIGPLNIFRSSHAALALRSPLKIGMPWKIHDLLASLDRSIIESAAENFTMPR